MPPDAYPPTTTAAGPAKCPQRGKKKLVIDQEEYALPRVRRERPPHILDWIKKAKPRIDSKERGTIVFKPWPEQMAVLEKFMEGSTGIIKKGRQIGFTTTLEIAYAFCFLYKEPFHGHFVSSTDEKMQRMMWETRLALRTAELQPGQRERIEWGTDRLATMKYETPSAASYIQGHAPIPRLEGYPGNAVLLDEATLMPYLEHIHTSFAGMLSDGWCNLWMIGVPKSDGVGNQFFSEFYDKAVPGSGIFRMRVDWRANPNRDAKWLLAQLPKFGFREDLRDEAHCCLDIMPRDMAFDPERMAGYAKPVEYLGQQALRGHNYSLGVDQSSAGECSTVGCIIDVTVRPCQVVALKTFRMDAQNSEGRTLQKAGWIDEMGQEFPGLVYIDSTNEKGTVETVRLKSKVAARISGTTQATEGVDDDGIRKVVWPRGKLIDNAVRLTDTGAVVVDPKRFPELYEAFKTARKWIPGQTKKNSGKNVDELDAFLLACIPLTGRAMGVQNGVRAQVIESSRGRRHAGQRPSSATGAQGSWRHYPPPPKR